VIGAVFYVVAAVVAPVSDSLAADQLADSSVVSHQAVESKQAGEIHEAYLPYYGIRPTYLPYY
jgi:hypothetical protein